MSATHTQEVRMLELLGALTRAASHRNWLYRSVGSVAAILTAAAVATERPPLEILAPLHVVDVSGLGGVVEKLPVGQAALAAAGMMLVLMITRTLYAGRGDTNRVVVAGYPQLEHRIPATVLMLLLIAVESGLEPVFVSLVAALLGVLASATVSGVALAGWILIKYRKRPAPRMAAVLSRIARAAACVVLAVGLALLSIVYAAAYIPMRVWCWASSGDQWGALHHSGNLLHPHAVVEAPTGAIRCRTAPLA
jgi:hypothetical protein